MVLLQRNRPVNPGKRPHPPPDAEGPGTSTAAAPGPGPTSAVDAAAALLADAGCTLLVPPHQAPLLPAPHAFAARLGRALSADPSASARLLAGITAFADASPARLRQLLLPTASAPHAPSLARALLSVPAIQPGLLTLLLEKLPEHFHDGGALGGLPLQDDVGRLIVSQFRWLDFLVDADSFVEKLVEVLSVAPPRLKKEIIGSLPEIVGDQSHASVVVALQKLLQEDSEVVVAVLDVLSDLNLNEELQEQVRMAHFSLPLFCNAIRNFNLISCYDMMIWTERFSYAPVEHLKAVTIAISCIRTIAADQMPHLLRFLLLSATPANAGRIILQIREQLRIVGAIDPRAARSKKLKGKASANSTDGAILDTLRSGLRFKNMLCEIFLKELKSVDHPKDHKVIDVWLIMLIYANGGALQKSAEKILKSKILQGYIRETLFDQCIHGNAEVVKEHFMSFLSVSDYLLACKEEKAREFASYLFTALFEEFSDTYSRQELVGSLVAHIGSGVSYEVSSSLDIMINLTSNSSEELISISSHITGILDYLESFHEDNLRKVYDIFCNLALAAGFNTGSGASSVANELLMVVRKQVSNPDMKYKRMGIIGALRIVSTIAGADVNAAVNCSPSQQPNCEEALELLKMSVNSCKFLTLPLIFLYDELVSLLESKVLHSAIRDWVGEHVAEFDTPFLADLNNGELSEKHLYDGIEGELWMNLDGNLSPICVNIMPLASSSPQKSQPCLQILSSQFSLLTTIERLVNEGSLGGLNALLGCPLHLPSTKHLDVAKWGNLPGLQKKAVCHSLYYAINWIRELVPVSKTQGTQGASSSFPTLCSSTIPSWYRVLHEENTGSLNKMIKQALKTKTLAERGSIDTTLRQMQKSVEVFVSLIQMCKTHEKLNMGEKYVDTFLKAFSLLESQFQEHNAIILKMQHLDPDPAQGYKRTTITSKVPPVKRSMERFLFQVKALLHNCSTEKKFCMGNLKHKDLHGHVVSSQVYGSVDDEDETDSDTPADENDNTMDEDVAEGSNGTPMEEE
ncbi:hypothetical protein HU200_016234 [Digitaria exilis]|uniref:Fanconi anemia group D2 protein n=1 Tax=Digitaria exilis TaxID=1010633 RepID=A0A835FA70_9POAL|nr:hypothetical protein HU200_016234 [Digitaria exilis]